MSVPVLLTAMDETTDTTVGPPTPPPTPPLEHVQNCANYAESAAATLMQQRPKHIPNLTHVPFIDEKSSCPATYRAFTVQLSMHLESNELVALTGDSAALGEWQLDRAIPLRPYSNMQWSANVLLQACRNMSYRYFTYMLDAQGNKLIRRWETPMQPRTLKPCNFNCAQVDRFGEIEMGEIILKRGWLTSETIVQLKFDREQMFQVMDVNKFDPENLLIKVVPLHEDKLTVVEPNEGLLVEVAKLQYGDSHLQPQQSFGIDYKRGDVVIFHLTLPRSMKHAFALVFHTPQQQAIGKALITADQLQGSEGVLELNVSDPANFGLVQVATLTLPYLVVKPMDGVELDFRSTYAHYWPKSWPNLDVGHRGNGRSYNDDPPEERENTVASFLRAHEAKADMIELDVHLTSDGVPVIYHDFVVKTAPLGKEINCPDQLEAVLIKDITYVALKELRVFAVIKNEVHEYPSHNAEPIEDNRIFPSLLTVLQALPRSLGIDVEIKWPQRTACGGVEAKQSIDKNYFADRVLQTVLQHGCGRALIFSSFDADLCTMLRFKQNLLPVMFLTMGKTTKWRPFLDLRTRNFEQAVNFAQAFELAGTAPHAEDFLGADGAKMMQLARDMGQIAVVWGDDINSPERVKYFSDIGATATCYDRSDLNMPEGKQGSFFNTQRALAVFEGQLKKCGML